MMVLGQMSNNRVVCSVLSRTARGGGGGNSPPPPTLIYSKDNRLFSWLVVLY